MPKRDDLGQLHNVTDRDREWARERMEALGIGTAKLAKTVGITRQALYLVLNGETRRSWHWSLIVKALGGDPPKTPGTDPRLEEIIRRWPELSDDDRALVEATARRLSKKS